MPTINKFWVLMKNVLQDARQIISARVEPLGISVAEGNILFQLCTGGGVLQQDELANALDVGKAAISRSITALEEKGFVSRVQKAGNRRSFGVVITDKTKSIQEELIEAYSHMYRCATKGITQDRLSEIEAVLSLVSNNMKSEDVR